MEIVKSIKQLSWQKVFAILICVLFMAGILIDEISEIYRMNSSLRWIYEYGQKSSLVLVYGMLLWSPLNALFLSKRRNNLLWVVISLGPIIYLVITFLAWHFEF